MVELGNKFLQDKYYPLMMEAIQRRPASLGTSSAQMVGQRDVRKFDAADASIKTKNVPKVPFDADNVSDHVRQQREEAFNYLHKRDLEAIDLEIEEKLLLPKQHQPK